MLLDAEDSQLVLVDYQHRLMPSIHEAERVVPNDHIGGPQSGKEHQPARLAAPGHARDQVDGGRIAPLQIFQHEHDRAVLRQHFEGVGHLAQHARRRRDPRCARRCGSGWALRDRG